MIASAPLPQLRTAAAARPPVSNAAGCAANLNAQQMRWLLSYTAQQASGLASWQRDTEHVEKAFDFGGMPARNGVTAALFGTKLTVNWKEGTTARRLDLDLAALRATLGGSSSPGGGKGSP